MLLNHLYSKMITGPRKGGDRDGREEGSPKEGGKEREEEKVG